MRTIMGLFGRSPFGPLEQHADRVQETVALLRPILEAHIEGDWELTATLHRRISDLEHEADVIKNEIRDHLPRSLFLPVDRGDVLRYLREQDAIADAIEDLAVLLSLRHRPAPGELSDPLLRFVELVLGTTEIWYRTAKELSTLQEAAFVGPEVEKTMGWIRQISDQEREADEQQLALTRTLFDREDEFGAVTVFFWMRVFGVLGEVANHAENTAELVRLMVARR